MFNPAGHFGRRVGSDHLLRSLQAFVHRRQHRILEHLDVFGIDGSGSRSSPRAPPGAR